MVNGVCSCGKEHRDQDPFGSDLFPHIDTDQVEGFNQA